MPTFAAVPGITLYPLASGAALRCIRDPLGASLAEHPNVPRVWAVACAANPHLHDGRMISVRAIAQHGARLSIADDHYRRLVAQSHADVGDLGVRLLGVKALILGADRTGREHVLINRRHPQTRVYGGMWEVGPGGGANELATLPASEADPITAAHLLAHLDRESREELGIDLLARTASEPPERSSAAAVINDSIAQSVDVVFVRRWLGAVDPRSSLCALEGRDWEYIDSAWLAIDDLPAFDTQHAHAITPPTRALWRWLDFAAQT